MNLAHKILLDQMFDRGVLARLRELGYDVVAVSEIGMSTADDSEIVQWAIAHDRTVITLDEHFGDWSILPLSAHSGVIRLKVNPTTTTNTPQSAGSIPCCQRWKEFQKSPGHSTPVRRQMD